MYSFFCANCDGQEAGGANVRLRDNEVRDQQKDVATPRVPRGHLECRTGYSLCTHQRVFQVTLLICYFILYEF